MVESYIDVPRPKKTHKTVLLECDSIPASADSKSQELRNLRTQKPKLV